MDDLFNFDAFNSLDFSTTEQINSTVEPQLTLGGFVPTHQTSQAQATPQTTPQPQVSPPVAIKPKRERRLPWSKAEDELLQAEVLKLDDLHSNAVWDQIARAVEGRTGNACRRRWDVLIAGATGAASSPTVRVKESPWTSKDDSSLRHQLTVGKCSLQTAASKLNRSLKACSRRWELIRNRQDSDDGRASEEEEEGMVATKKRKLAPTRTSSRKSTRSSTKSSSSTSKGQIIYISDDSDDEEAEGVSSPAASSFHFVEDTKPFLQTPSTPTAQPPSSVGAAVSSSAKMSQAAMLRCAFELGARQAAAKAELEKVTKAQESLFAQFGGGFG